MLRCLVLSDLHAVVGTEPDDASFMAFHDGKSDFAERTLLFLKALNLTCDLLVCPGDITHQADADSFVLGWKFLERVRSELGISKVVAVPGNHDHRSREAIRGHDPRIHMQYSSPPFPSTSDETNTHFWAWRWSHVEHEQFNVLQLDTSAFHGFGKDEQDHGRLHFQTRTHIMNHLRSNEFRKKDVNLLVCHHHPQATHGIGKEDDSEVMAGGAELLVELSVLGKGAWVVIHGHRHQPYVRLAHSMSSEQPLLISAGSMSMKLTEDYASSIGNQIHYVEIDMERTRNLGVPFGEIRTWQYASLGGWADSTKPNLPHRGGFGARETPTAIYNQIKTILHESSIVPHAQLIQLIPQIEHLLPDDLRVLAQMLDRENMQIYGDPGRVEGIGVKK